MLMLKTLIPSAPSEMPTFFFFFFELLRQVHSVAGPLFCCSCECFAFSQSGLLGFH